VSELLQAVCTKLLDICCGFASILSLNFGGRGASMVVVIEYVGQGVGELL